MKRSFLMTRNIIVAFAVLGLMVGAARAETLSQMRERWLEEAQRLESMNARYAKLAAERSKALDALVAASNAVDTAMADPKVPVDDLRELEDRLTNARDEALQLAEDASSLRRQIYDQLDVVSQLGADVEGLETGKLVEDAGVAGMWRAEWDGSRDFGLVKLESNGAVITGSYRLTNGNAGSLKGTFGGTELRLDVIASSSGFAGQVVAQLVDDDTLEGTFVRNDLSSQQRASGSITLMRLDADEASGILDDLRR